jgi:hypothetical protein
MGGVVSGHGTYAPQGAGEGLTNSVAGIESLALHAAAGGRVQQRPLTLKSRFRDATCAPRDWEDCAVQTVIISGFNSPVQEIDNVRCGGNLLTKDQPVPAGVNR